MVLGNEQRDQSSNPGNTVCILHNANTLGKSMHPTILLPAMGK